MAESHGATAPSIGFLAACARALARSGELDDVLENLLRATVDELDAAAAAVFVLDDERGELVLAVGVGVPRPAGGEGAEDQVVVPTGGDDALAEAIRRGGPVTAGPGPGSQSWLLEQTGLRAGLFLSLDVVRDGIDRTAGALGLAWPDTVPDEATLATASAVADLAAVAVDRARSLSTSAERADWQDRLAHTDALTGLANRRTFDRMLELELARAARQGSEVTVVVFDIDEFGETNRVAGRPAGEAVLRTLASILAESVRLVDTVGRYGTDEFAIVAPGSAGTAVAERVLAGVAGLGDVAGHRVSVSAGVARFPEDGATAAELLQAAMDGVRAAKAAGGGAIGKAPGTA